MTYVAATIVLIASLAGVALTLLTMPGIWLMIGVAILCALWRGDMFSIWTLAAAVLLGVLAEIVELVASAAGSKKAGGTRAGAIGSIVGGVLGALAGTIFIPVPILGTLMGAVAGAALGALVGERGISARTWRESAASARGAATGRLVASVAKTALAAVIAVLLSVAAFLPWF